MQVSRTVSIELPNDEYDEDLEECPSRSCTGLLTFDVPALSGAPATPKARYLFYNPRRLVTAFNKAVEAFQTTLDKELWK